MAKQNSKRKRKSRTSSGKRRVSRARQALNRTEMKIARWKKNQTDEKKAAAGKSRGDWNTEGLERHVQTLQKVIKQGPTKKKYVSSSSSLFN